MKIEDEKIADERLHEFVGALQGPRQTLTIEAIEIPVMAAELIGWRREAQKCVKVARNTLAASAPAHLSTIAECVVALGAQIERQAAELLAKREECERQQERIDLDVDEFRRILAELDNLRVRIVPTPEGARILYDVVQGIVLRATNAGRQRVPLIGQRDNAEAERDAARAEAEQAKQRLAEWERIADQRGHRLEQIATALRSEKTAIGFDPVCGNEIVDAALMMRERAEKAEARLAQVERQRDEFAGLVVEACSFIDDTVGFEPANQCVRKCRKAVQAIAEQPKPAEPCKSCDGTGTVEKCDWPGEHANRYQEPCGECRRPKPAEPRGEGGA